MLFVCCDLLSDFKKRSLIYTSKALTRSIKPVVICFQILKNDL